MHVSLLPVISTNKAELVEVNGYGYISANDETENVFYAV